MAMPDEDKYKQPELTAGSVVAGVDMTVVYPDFDKNELKRYVVG